MPMVTAAAVEGAELAVYAGVMARLVQAAQDLAALPLMVEAVDPVVPPMSPSEPPPAPPMP